MKKLKIILGILTIVAATIQHSYAQPNGTDTRDKLVFGLKVGANYSTVYATQGQNFNANGKVGVAGGAFLAIPIGRFLGLQPEVLFSQRGITATGNVQNDSYSLSRTSSYIDVPLFVAFKPIENLTLLLGPQYSFLVVENDVFANVASSPAQLQQFSNDNTQRNTLSAVAGADVNIQHFVLGVRAGMDMFYNNGNVTSGGPQYKYVWGQVTVGFRLY
jgi:hypothetical protein